jgi:hypothetical protein
MRFLPTVLILLAACADVKAQPPSASTATATTPEEFRAFWTEVREAATKKDRAALERVFAPEFIWVHAYGYINDRASVIEQILRGLLPRFLNLDPNEVFAAKDKAALFLYNDVVVFRVRGATSEGSPALGVWVAAKRNGHYQFVYTQGTEMQPERQWLTLPTDTLDAYAGRYKGTNVIALKRESDTLVAEAPVMGRLILRPTSETLFFDKAGGEWTFHRGPDGKVAYYVRRFRGQERRATRIE